MLKARYKYERKTGKFVSGSIYASELETAKITRNYINAKKQELMDIGSLFVGAKITAADFRVASAQILKSIHIANASLAKRKLSSKDLDAITNVLKEQFETGKGKNGKPFGLGVLIDDVLRGKVSNAQVRNRLRMFGDSGQVSYAVVRESDAIASGFTLCRRIRVEDERSCSECLAFAAMGWQPVGRLTLPKIFCTCGANCRCYLEYK